MTHNLFGSSSLKGRESQAKDDPSMQIGGTGHRWHGMKGRFRPLFGNVELVEDWYNRIAPPKMKEKFRKVTKSLISIPADKLGKEAISKTVDPAEWHRANHVLRLYGDIFTDNCTKDRVVAFLCHASQQERDMFGDTMNSILSVYPSRSQTKSAWVPLDRLADKPDRERFRKIIDWNSLTAAEKVRQGYINPMDQKHLGLQEIKSTKEEADETLAHIPTQLKLGKKRTIGAMQAVIDSAEATARGGGKDGEEVQEELGHVASELTKNKKSYLELTGGRYEVNPRSGATLYQVKGNATSSAFTKRGGASMKERIVSASGVPSHSWKSTAKDHFPNLSHGLMNMPGMGRVDPERHPCVARTTAATCMIVPSLQPKRDQVIPERLRL